MHPFYGPNGELLNGGTWWLGLISMVLYLLFWAVVIFIVLRLFKKYYTMWNQQGSREDTAMTVLRERYARGEIDEEEFRSRKAVLEE
ncbi:putative membrane protein [Dethiosulfatibacter aminovorans DSM 17477]|uniref:Putative membrane protein n=1 Tax=Dethiosulfatibacter aminovorans DSM 17477 TaxID=1121476 RepID=A0A1M6HQ01_9FIRM|nr:SHOCT domain-containing protein [Dethiosulfatibacter aminovorans]SHJ24194.1 putative membrane protein [Dethiosulfatibacter aminovorans DSM 17477]